MEVAGPLGTPLGLAQRKRASPRGEAGTEHRVRRWNQEREPPAAGEWTVQWARQVRSPGNRLRAREQHTCLPAPTAAKGPEAGVFISPSTA